VSRSLCIVWACSSRIRLRRSRIYGSGKAKNRDTRCAGIKKQSRQSRRRGSGREDVINEQDRAIPYALGTRDPEGPVEVPPSVSTAIEALGGRVPYPQHGLQLQGKPQRMGQRSAEQHGLVELSLAESCPMQRDGQEEVEGILRKEHPEAASHPCSQGRSQKQVPAVFESENGFPQVAFVRTHAPNAEVWARGPGAVETGRANKRLRPVERGRNRPSANGAKGRAERLEGFSAARAEGILAVRCGAPAERADSRQQNVQDLAEKRTNAE